MHALQAFSPDVRAGHCWAMAGDTGYITRRLAAPVAISAIVLEHASAAAVSVMR